MNNDKILAIFLTILMVGSVFAIATPVAAQDDGEINISLQPSDAEVDPGEEQTYEIVVEEPDNGVSAYDLTVTLDDAAVATFTDYEVLEGSDGDQTPLADVTLEDDMVEFEVGLLDRTFPAGEEAVIATVTAEAEGDLGDSTNLAIEDGAQVSDNDDVQYDVLELTGAELTIPEDVEDVAPVLFFPDQTSDGTSVFVEDVNPGSGDLAGEEVQIWADTDFDGEYDTLVGTEAAVEADFLTIELDEALPAAPYDMQAVVVDADGETQFEMSAEVNVVDPDTEVVDADQWESTHWEGQVLRVDLSDADVSEGEVVQVREVTSFDQANPSSDRLTRELPVDSNENVIVDTARLAGENDYLLAHQGNYYETGTSDFTGDLGDAAVAEVLEQDLSTEFQDEQIQLQFDEVVETGVDVESIRQRFDVQISGTVDDEYLSAGQLDSIFGDNDPQSETGATVFGVPYVEIPNVQDLTTLDAEFDEDVLEDGEYDFTFDVTDSTAVDTDNITVNEAVDEEVTIASPRPGEGDTFQRGDIVPITLEYQGTDVGTLTFGDRSSGQSVEINVTVRDADDSGTATVYLNTFQTGDGPVYDEDGNVVEAGDYYDDDRVTDRNHGFFTLGSGAELVGEDGMEAVAHRESLAILGGPSGQGILAATGYDLISTAGEHPYSEDDVTVDDRSIVRLDERGTDNMTVWTAPGTGENEIEPEFIDDIYEGVEDGIITPADGTIANHDFLVLEIPSTGLEGLMHEAVLLDDDLDVDDFLDREDDHIVSDEFFATDLVRENAAGLEGPVIQTYTEQTNVGPNEEAAVLDLEFGDVIAGVDDTGNLNEYYITVPLEAGETPTLNKELATNMEFYSFFDIQPVAGGQDLMPHNPPLWNFEMVDGEPVSLESSEETWSFLPDTADVDREGDVLHVAKEDDIEIAGTTNVAAGTNLTVNLVTVAGQDDPFFKPNTVITQYEEEAPNTWSLTEDFADYEVGTEFEVNIIRTGAAGTITPTGEPIPGLVTDEPAVNEFVFEDQRSGGQSVVIQTFNTTQGGFIGIYDADGEQIGFSDHQPIGERTNVAMSLDVELEDNQELTATAYRTEDRAYVDEDGDPIQRTAFVEIEDESPAFFDVHDLQPQTERLDEPGPDVDISAIITNRGDQEDTQTIELRIDGQVVDSEDVTLAGGENENVMFTVSTADLAHGTDYTHTIASENDDASGALIIAEEPTPEPETPTPEVIEVTPEDPDDDADDDGAGFGIVVAMLAFLGAALLAVRRQVRE